MHEDLHPRLFNSTNWPRDEMFDSHFFPLLKALTESRLKWNRLLFQILDLGAKPTLKLFFYRFALWLGHVYVSIFLPKKSL